MDEARRQVEICNACRYCEGYCAVFPAMTRQKAFADGDITQLANLCHNCRGCYYACQYTEPHEFALNLPRALAEVRTESWDRFAWPGALGGLFQRSGVALAAALVAGIAAAVPGGPGAAGRGRGLLCLSRSLGDGGDLRARLPAAARRDGDGPARLLARGGRRARHPVGPARRDPVGGAAEEPLGRAGTGLQLREGRPLFRHAPDHASGVLYGFLLCFASTSSGTVLHYVFALEAPYSLFSLPKLLGVPGGIALSVGALGLAWLKTKADPELGAPDTGGGQMGFVLLLALSGSRGCCSMPRRAPVRSRSCWRCIWAGCSPSSCSCPIPRWRTASTASRRWCATRRSRGGPDAYIRRELT